VKETPGIDEENSLKSLVITKEKEGGGKIYLNTTTGGGEKLLYTCKRGKIGWEEEGKGQSRMIKGEE